MTKASSYTEGAHIYGFAMGKHLTRKDSMHWDILRMFWSDQAVTAWQDLLFTPSNTEFLANMITMGKTVQAAWDHAEFALKPIGTNDRKTEMTVKFYWLRRRSRTDSSDHTHVSLLDIPALPSNYPSGSGNLRFFDCLSGREICSGDTILFHTNDPVKSPLPSEDLLWMQWHLSRVAALSGASEIFESYPNGDGWDSDAVIVEEDSEDEYTDPYWKNKVSEKVVESDPASSNPFTCVLR